MTTRPLMLLLVSAGTLVAVAWALLFLPILSLTTEPAAGHAVQAYSAALLPPAAATGLFFAAAWVGFRRRNEAGARRVARVAVSIMLGLVGVFGVWYTVEVFMTIAPCHC